MFKNSTSFFKTAIFFKTYSHAQGKHVDSTKMEQYVNFENPCVPTFCRFHGSVLLPMPGGLFDVRGPSPDILSIFRASTNEPILNRIPNFQQDGSFSSPASCVWWYLHCSLCCSFCSLQMVACNNCLSIQSVVVNCYVESCSSLQSPQCFPNLHILHSQFYQCTGLQWGL